MKKRVAFPCSLCICMYMSVDCEEKQVLSIFLVTFFPPPFLHYSENSSLYLSQKDMAVLAFDVPSPWFASKRKDNGELVSGSWACRLPLTETAALQLLGKVCDGVQKMTKSGAQITLDTVHRVLSVQVVGGVLLSNLEQVRVYCECKHTMVPVPPLRIEWTLECVTEWHKACMEAMDKGCKSVPTCLIININRNLPLSSASGNSPMVCVFFFKWMRYACILFLILMFGFSLHPSPLAEIVCINWRRWRHCIFVQSHYDICSPEQECKTENSSTSACFRYSCTRQRCC